MAAFNKNDPLAVAIREGVAADGTPGDELLQRIGDPSFWPLNAFGMTGIAGDVGCKFKVSGNKFKGDVAIRSSSADPTYVDVFFGEIVKKEFKMKDSFCVRKDGLAALLGAVVDDVDAEVVVE